MITEYIHASNVLVVSHWSNLENPHRSSTPHLKFAGGKQYTRCNVLQKITHILYLYSYRTIYLIRLWFWIIVDCRHLNCISEWVQWLPPWFFPLGFPNFQNKQGLSKTRPPPWWDSQAQWSSPAIRREQDQLGICNHPPTVIPHRPPWLLFEKGGAPFVPVPSAITISRCGLRTAKTPFLVTSKHQNLSVSKNELCTQESM